MNPKIKDMVNIAMMAAVISVLSPISIPLVGEVPISLATFAVMLAGSVLGARKGSMAVIIYLLLAAIGVPVLAGWTGGVGKLIGVTGGFLFGYIPLAFFTGLGAEKSLKSDNMIWLTAGMLIGNAVLYAMGTVWFMFTTQSDLMTALMACVIPFLIGDAVKMAVTQLIASQLLRMKVLQKYLPVFN